MIYIGIDPASAKQTAVAIVTDVETHLLLVDTYDPYDLYDQLNKLDIPDEPVTLTVEGQKIYAMSAVKTKIVLDLANRSGFFEGLFLTIYNVVDIHRPEPAQWKGQVPEKVYTRRIMKKYPQVAKLVAGYNKQETSDLCHAYGLALFPRK